jgi:DNA-binding transcriptional LysR family regulator
LEKWAANMQDLNWNDLRYVLAIARSNGAHGPASRLLGVNETTVSRRLLRIEAALGSKLFQRSEGSLRQTDAGHRVVEHAERIELEVEAVKEIAIGSKSAVAGSVRLTSIPILISYLLIPDLKRLYSGCPDLRIEFIAEARNLSLTKRDADLALRLARPNKEQRVIARRIAQIKYSVYGAGKSSKLPWIVYEDRMLELPHAAWLQQKARTESGIPSVVVNDAELALHAVKAGLGRSLLPTFIGDKERGLARLSGGEAVLERELWLLVHPELKHLARIKAVVGWIEQSVSSHLRT